MNNTHTHTHTVIFLLLFNANYLVRAKSQTNIYLPLRNMYRKTLNVLHHERVTINKNRRNVALYEMILKITLSLDCTDVFRFRMREHNRFRFNIMILVELKDCEGD